MKLLSKIKTLPLIALSLVVVSCGGGGASSTQIEPPKDNPPVVRIISPSNNSEYPANTPITLEGEAIDPEDGILSGQSLRWSSSIQGHIGEGSKVADVKLTTGTHVITLSATDSKNNSTAATVNVTIKPQVIEDCAARSPDEQLASLKYEYNAYPSPPPGHVAIIAWANVTMGKAKYGTKGRAIVQSLEIIERVNGDEKIIASKITCPPCDLDNKVWGYLIHKSQWMNPAAWNKPNEGRYFYITPEGYVEMRVDEHPDMNYHFWNTIDPRPNASANAKYYVRAKVKTEGNALVQIGFDYWTSTQGGTNLEGEGGYSNWYCNLNGEDWQIAYAGAYK